MRMDCMFKKIIKLFEYHKLSIIYDVMGVKYVINLQSNRDKVDDDEDDDWVFPRTFVLKKRQRMQTTFFH